MKTKADLALGAIKEALFKGVWVVGERLPTEEEMSKTFGICRHTLRKALKLLVDEGLLQSRQGSGTYVLRRRPCLKFQSKLVGGISNGPTQIFRSVGEPLKERGYVFECTITDGDVYSERQALVGLLARQVDAVLFMASESGLGQINRDVCDEMIRVGIPIIQVADAYETMDVPTFCRDNIFVGEQSANFFLGRGHLKAAGIFLCDSSESQDVRVGFERVFLSECIKQKQLQRPLIFWTGRGEPDIDFKELVRKLQSENVTAVVCQSASICRKLLGGLSEQGGRIMDVLCLEEVPTEVNPSYIVSSCPYPWDDIALSISDVLFKLESGEADYDVGLSRKFRGEPPDTPPLPIKKRSGRALRQKQPVEQQPPPQLDQITFF